MKSLQTLLKQELLEFSIEKIHHPHLLEKCLSTALANSPAPQALCYANKAKYFQTAITNPHTLAIICPTQLFEKLPSQKDDKCFILTPKSEELFYYIHNQAIHRNNPNTTAPSSIALSATISPDATIGKNVTIGEECIIHPGCRISSNTIIDNGTILHPNVTIGTEGYLAKTIKEKKEHIFHYGGVYIGKNCVIHAGSNISRALCYGEKTKVGNNVHIGIQTNLGHDVNVGANSSLSGNIFVGGRTTIGKNCWISGGSTISQSLSIGDNVSLMLGSVVIKNIPSGKTLSGNFASDHTKNLREYVRKEYE